MRNSTRLFGLAVFPLLAACSVSSGEPSQEKTGKASSAIQGGSLDNNAADSFAVGIATKQGAMCSGTLIAPNLVLTARHCVVPPSADEAVTCADKFPANVSASSLVVITEANLFRARSYIPAKEIITPAETGFCGNDIALLILSQNIPASTATPVTPVVRFKMTDADAPLGDVVTAIGFGITSPSAQDSGQRRIKQDISIVCVPGSADKDCTGRNAYLSDSANEFVTAGYVCSGDSGSGAFDQKSYEAGKAYVMGTLSRGPQTETKCLEAIYTRTDAHADLIINAGLKAAEAGGYDAPEWVKPASTPGTPGSPGSNCDGDDCTDTNPTDPSSGGNGNAGSGDGSTTTTTSGCSAAPQQHSGSNAALAFGVLGLGLVVARRRRK